MILKVFADKSQLGKAAAEQAAAAISRRTKAIAVAVSQSSGTVRIFLHGEVVLRVEPFARPLIWRRFELETEQGGDGIGSPVSD